jgi:hypothetical protein
MPGIDIGTNYVSNKYMPGTELDYRVLHNWYSSTNFTQGGPVQYKYFVRAGNTFNGIPKNGQVSFELDQINKKYSSLLHKLFEKPYNNKMYVHAVANDLYFVVPTIDKQTNAIIGSHYSFHNIAVFSPDRDPSLVFNDVIDIHKTTYDDRNRKIKHDPKCVFHNKHQVPIKKDGLCLDNVVCYNKAQGNHRFYKTTFTDPLERDLLRDIISMPFESEIKKKSSAAKKIASAYKAYKSVGVGGGAEIQAVYVVLVRDGKNWHKTFNMLDGSGMIVDWFHSIGGSIAQKQLLLEIKNFVAA